MDCFGWSLWTELMMNNEDWNSSMNLPLDEEGEFVPDKNGWDIIFERLDESLKESGLEGKLGGCYHTSSSVPRILRDTGLHSEFKESFENYRKNHTFEFGMHSTFGRDDLVCAGNFENILAHDLEMCSLLDGSCIVEHSQVPMKHRENSIKMMVDELSSKPIVDLMLKYPKISLSWENGGSAKMLIGSLDALVDLIEALEDKFNEIGHPDIGKRHNLCLDTGHLLLAAKSSRKIRKDIEHSLPRFSKYLKVFHIHANNGKSDNHIIPNSLEFFDHSSRKGINPTKFMKNSETVWKWLKICNEQKGVEERHIHLEALRMPFSMQQIIEFGKRYCSMID